MKDSETKKEETDPSPRVFAIKCGTSVWNMSKREFLKTAATGVISAVAIGCNDQNGGNPPRDPNNAIPPFTVGGTTYRLIDLKDYNGILPPTGMNLAIVGYVQNDFYFRYFDGQGRQVVNQHETKVDNKAALSEIKTLVTSVAAKGVAEPSEQGRFADLFSTIKTDAENRSKSSGRRMQGSEGRVARGRRMQGTAATGTMSGRRMQGAEGRVEAGMPQRNLGTLLINGERYDNSRIVESYTDGYTKISYSGGIKVVRTDSLPDVVQLQLPHPIANPAPRPSTVPRTTTTVVPATPITAEPSTPAETSRPTEPSRPAPRRRPAPRSTPSDDGGYVSHYWRPN